MAKVVSTWNFAKALEAEGYPLPREVAHVEILLPPDGPMQLLFRVNVTDEDFPKVSKALASLGTKG